jgi:electron transfer flavoprotein-quinone oxidoreductase
MLRHPQLRRLLKGATPLEYSAHLVPEGGFEVIPPLYTDGMLVAGDAAGLCYNNGLNLEGMNLALTSGALAAETALQACRSGDSRSHILAGYRRKLEESFVLSDMKTFKNAAAALHIERLFQAYPQVLIRVLDRIYRADEAPRSRLRRLVRQELLNEVPLKELLADGIKIGRSLL